jgi:hypothetical protein
MVVVAALAMVVKGTSGFVTVVGYHRLEVVGRCPGIVLVQRLGETADSHKCIRVAVEDESAGAEAVESQRHTVGIQSLLNRRGPDTYTHGENRDTHLEPVASAVSENPAGVEASECRATLQNLNFNQSETAYNMTSLCSS